MRLLAVVLAAALAVPAAAQVVPDEFPDPGESLAERNQRELEERHLGLLSRLYGGGSVVAGPGLGAPGAFAGSTAEGGFRLRNGDAVALYAGFRVPLALADPGAGGRFVEGVSLAGFEYLLGLDRHVPALGSGAELGLGVGLSAGALDGTTLEVSPRYAVPLGRLTTLPVGVRASYGLGDAAVGTSPLFVGLSVGLRQGWVSRSRMVLE